MFVRGRRVALACAAAAVVLVGCSSGDKPVALPSLSPTASPSVNPSSTASTSEVTAATAVVREYFALKSALSQRMDPEPLAAIETSDCVCRKFLESIRETRAQGNRYFGTTNIRSMTPSADGPAQVEVLVEYDTSAGGTKSSDGHVIFKGRPRRGVKALFTLKLEGSRWLVADIANIEPGVSA